MFKRILIIFGILVLASLAFLFFYEKRSTDKQNSSYYTLPENEQKLLQDGDLIMRKGYGIISESIAELLNENPCLSHIGVVCKKPGHKIEIIHSLSATYADFDGVQKCSFRKFCKESQPGSIVVVRFKQNKESPLSKISKQAQHYASLKVPFDNGFDLSTPENFYCTELIWHIFLDEYGFDIYPSMGNFSDLGFKPFFDTANFEQILPVLSAKP